MAIDLEKYKLPTSSSVNLDKYKTVQESSQIPDTRSISDKIWEGIASAGTDITNFLGGRAVAETLGSELAKIGKPQNEKDIISAEQPTLKQTAGSALQLGT